jgi:hypothetical protein
VWASQPEFTCMWADTRLHFYFTGAAYATASLRRSTRCRRLRWINQIAKTSLLLPRLSVDMIIAIITFLNILSNRPSRRSGLWLYTMRLGGECPAGYAVTNQW